MLKSRLNKNGILNEVLEKQVLEDLLSGEDKTWFGQLMSTPQLIAWLVQFDYWAETYGVEFER